MVFDSKRSKPDHCVFSWLLNGENTGVHVVLRTCHRVVYKYPTTLRNTPSSSCSTTDIRSCRNCETSAPGANLPCPRSMSYSLPRRGATPMSKSCSSRLLHQAVGCHLERMEAAAARSWRARSRTSRPRRRQLSSCFLGALGVSVSSSCKRARPAHERRRTTLIDSKQRQKWHCRCWSSPPEGIIRNSMRNSYQVL